MCKICNDVTYDTDRMTRLATSLATGQNATRALGNNPSGCEYMNPPSLDQPANARDYLLSFDLWKGPAQQEGINYLNDAFQRLLTP
jgi:hypothetical protein